MKRLGVVILFVFLTLKLMSQNPGGDTIIWSSDYKLSATDFQNRKKSNGRLAAATSCQILTTYYYSQDSITLCVYAIFLKKRSYLIAPYFSDRLLKHEQVHFDITELYSRKLREKVSRMSFNDSFNRFKFNKIRNRYVNSCSRFQKKYDRRTEHGLLIKRQRKLEQSIERKLIKLQKFHNPCLVRLP